MSPCVVFVAPDIDNSLNDWLLVLQIFVTTGTFDLQYQNSLFPLLSQKPITQTLVIDID